MKRLLGIAALAVLVVGAWAHVRDDRSDRLLRDAATAHERVGYAGTAVERSGPWRHEVAVGHDAATGVTSYAWGRFRDVRAAPSTRTPDPAGWCVDVEALLANYRASAGEDVRFLGRAARRVAVVPRHDGRPRFDLLVDVATGLPLEVTTFGALGEVYRVTSFVDLETGPRVVEGPPRPHPFEGEPVPPRDLARAAGFPILLPDYLPEGFRCIGASVVRCGPAAAAVLVYSDGGTLTELRQSPAGGGGGEGDVTRRRRWRHFVYELRAGPVDVRLTSRADFDQEESLRLLRSLRPE